MEQKYENFQYIVLVQKYSTLAEITPYPVRPSLHITIIKSQKNKGQLFFFQNLFYIMQNANHLLLKIELRLLQFTERSK